MRGITNPIVPGWYADPEARTYQGRHYIYATRSFTEYTLQMNLDAFSSGDLIHWKVHESIIEMDDFPGSGGRYGHRPRLSITAGIILSLPRTISRRTVKPAGWRLPLRMLPKAPTGGTSTGR